MCDLVLKTHIHNKKLLTVTLFQLSSTLIIFPGFHSLKNKKKKTKMLYVTTKALKTSIFIYNI